MGNYRKADADTYTTTRKTPVISYNDTQEVNLAVCVYVSVCLSVCHMCYLSHYRMNTISPQGMCYYASTEKGYCQIMVITGRQMLTHILQRQDHTDIASYFHPVGRQMVHTTTTRQWVITGRQMLTHIPPQGRHLSFPIMTHRK